MRLPKLTPLQSRLAACISTSLLLLLLYFTIAPAHFAYATELDSITHNDHNHERIDLRLADVDWGDLENDAHTGYEPEFLVGAFGEDILGRAVTQDITPLKNNEPRQLNLLPGQTIYYVFENSSIAAPVSNRSIPALIPDVDSFGQLFPEKKSDTKQRLELRSTDGELLEQRQTQAQQKTIYLSANTCLQPNLNGSLSMPQLTMFVSTVNQNPGPGQPSDQQQSFEFDEGYVNATIQSSSAVYIGIHAPNLTATSQWNFVVAASIDGHYFSSNVTASAAFLIDSDSSSALIVSANLTNEMSLVYDPSQRTLWKQATPPFSMYIVNGSSYAINGLRRSQCGLSNIKIGSAKINSTITTRNAGNNPKQQFHVEGLSAGSSYYAVLAYDNSNRSAGNQLASGTGGGHIWQPFQFSTSIDDNCKLIYDLPFCTDVAYAVPSNSTATRDDLVSFYDQGAQAFWQNFTYSLQQIACNTTSTSQYSLARNCTDCARDYKTWLCSVTIPRCMDLSLPAGAGAVAQSPFIAPRNLAATKYINGSDVDLTTAGLNATDKQTPWYAQSRLTSIDTIVQPGPYRELLPCIDICYEMVKSCPASMGFGCPQQRPLLLRSYGILNDADAQGVSLACNRLGVDQPRSSLAPRPSQGFVLVLAAFASCTVLTMI